MNQTWFDWATETVTWGSTFSGAALFLAYLQRSTHRLNTVKRSSLFYRNNALNVQKDSPENFIQCLILHIPTLK
jgi:hypothetical protein